MPGSPFTRDDMNMFSIGDPANARGYAAMYGMDNPNWQIAPNGVAFNPRNPWEQGPFFPKVGEGRDPNGNVLPGYLKGSGELELQRQAAENLFQERKGITPNGGEYEIPKTLALQNAGMLPGGLLPGLGGGTPMGPASTTPGAPAAPTPFPSAPGSAPVAVPSPAAGPSPGPTAGANGLPPGALPTELPPAQKIALEKNQEAFQTVKAGAMEAQTKSQDLLAQLNANHALLQQAVVGKGANAYSDAAQWLQQMGLLNQEQASKVASTEILDNNTKNLLFKRLKSVFPSRISNMEMSALNEALGKATNMRQVVSYINDALRASSMRAMDFGSFVQTYKGDPGQWSNAWLNSPKGSQSLLEYPPMLNHLTVVRNAAGQYAARVPTATGYSLLRVVPNPQGGWLPANQ